MKTTEQKLRIALAALRKIKRIGYMGGSGKSIDRTEEAEIAHTAIKRMGA